MGGRSRSRNSVCPWSSTLLPYWTLFFFNDTATTEIYTLSLHDALPIYSLVHAQLGYVCGDRRRQACATRSEEHTSELQSPDHLVCRLLLEKNPAAISHQYPPLLHELRPSRQHMGRHRLPRP